MNMLSIVMFAILDIAMLHWPRRAEVAQAHSITVAREPGRQRLAVFTRNPCPGHAKTRLIPALGPEGAADLQRRMTHHTLGVARRWAVQPGRTVEVRFTGGERRRMAEAFGEDMAYVDQGNGSLGHRLNKAFAEAFQTGEHAVVAIGTDCPELDEPLLQQAFTALNTHDVVIGPASDGGYYLLGLRRPVPALFDGITWGTNQVLAQTRQVIDRLALKTAWLPERQDVDEPADLPVWERVAARQHDPAATPTLSVVIPTLHEAPRLPATIASIAPCGQVEVIVSDGGSTDDTIAVAEALGARVVRSSRGRAEQMNAGAAVARGSVLLFLHADTRLPAGYRGHIKRALEQPHVVAGAFRLRLDAPQWSLRLIETGANLRSRLFRLPYGDQALFLKRTVFCELGGFHQLPVMEDYEFVRRLRRKGRIAVARAHVVSSARRWRHCGPWRTTLTHQAMVLGWHFGLAPRRLAHWRDGRNRPRPVRHIFSRLIPWQKSDYQDQPLCDTDQ